MTVLQDEAERRKAMVGELMLTLDRPQYWHAYEHVASNLFGFDTLQKLFVAAMLGNYVRTWLKAVQVPEEQIDTLMLQAIDAAGKAAERRYQQRPQVRGGENGTP